MKRIVCLLLAAMLLLACVPAMAISARYVNNGDTLYVVGGTLNVRESGSSKAKVTYKLPKNCPVTALEDPTGSYVWVEFKYNGKFANGYVSLDYLTDEVPSKINTKGATAASGGSSSGSTDGQTVKSLSFKSFKLVENVKIIASKPSRAGGFVNFRWLPSQEAALIEKMYADEELTVIAEGKDWYQAQNDDGYIGFIMKKFTYVVYEGDGSDLQVAETAAADTAEIAQ